MKYAVLGAGLMGRAIAKDLLSEEADAVVSVFDCRDDLLKEVGAFVDDERLLPIRLDIRETAAVRALEGHALAIAALPHRLSLEGLRAALAARVSVVDLVGDDPEDRRALDSAAVAAGILIVPGCGVAPGLSNVLVARGVSGLDETRDAIIYVGGIPRKRQPPLEYQTVYALDTMFEMCVRPSRVFSEGRETSVDGMSGLELLEFPVPVGTLEAFYNDGLGSLVLTMKGKVRGELAEKTLRYPGFVEKIRFLKACGLLDTRQVQIGPTTIAPRDVVINQLSPLLQLSPEGDLLVMRVIVSGEKDGRQCTHTFDVLDFFDPRTGYTAMARTTGFSATCAARLIASGRVCGRGVRFPEEAFVGSTGDAFLDALQQRGIQIRHTTS